MEKAMDMTIFPFSMIPFGHFQASSSRRRPASSDATTAGYVLEHQCVGISREREANWARHRCNCRLILVQLQGLLRSEIPCQTGTACGSCSTARVSLSIAAMLLSAMAMARNAPEPRLMTSKSN